MKKLAITGLVMLLPLALTLWIISSLISWLTGPFVGIAEALLSAIGLTGIQFLCFSSEQILFLLSHFLVLVFLAGFILFIGAIGHYLVSSFFIRWGDSIIKRIPIVNAIYKTTNDLIQSLFSADKRAFTSVVLVPFPHNTCFSIGLVAKENPIDNEKIPVFVPTTPNPTSGHLLLFQRSEVIHLNMTVEEAFRYIISCGVLTQK